MPETTDMSQGELAYSQLYDAISRGDFHPGERLRETDIADRLSISRTPIREALRRLEADGIIEHRPRIGAVIRQLSHTEVVELYEMRAVLERTAAEMAAKHALEAETDEMAALNTAIEAAALDPHRAATINQQFHRCLYLATRNRFLLGSTRTLTNAMLLLGPTTLGDDERLAVVCAQHAQIIDAIRQGDAQRAGAAAQEHLQTSLRHRLMAMRT
ncbi:DNA-binding transcriptional regulator, GntR family [Monaibacterium marinum]|uniref:DNA-binding transcriptional regulator, GntR family n=1 Tax=Pontivivens marinum TaxID=1690039 RepID=A0A2C9CUY3_9RHOB|nr:GntR family transcriptional regulator [Monaibacterium marinum]SOH95013.1 DNA-binding transcriptional regulator, GntR family [Monaibacterium marinum]